MQTLTKQLVKQEGNLPEYVAHVDQTDLPERIIQFGEGNFLRGFVDWMVHETNKQGLFNGRIVAVQPTPHGKVVPKLNAQDGLYTLVLQGIEHNQQVEKYELVSSVSRGINPYENWEEILKVAESPAIEFVFSNTTEAGLTYVQEAFDPDNAPLSYPGKLTAFLYHRFRVMDGKPETGLTIIPCELVTGNGDLLKDIVNKIAKDWDLPAEFVEWLNNNNRFCNTLVDRIVPGYPKGNIEAYRSKLGYEDQLLTVGELYHLFVIDAGEQETELIPFQQAGLNVKWGDVTPYRQLKVGLLNAPHTMMFSVGFLSGVNTVSEFMEDETLYDFVRKAIFEELIPALPFEEGYKNEFAEGVLDRFSNPFIKHQLTDIGLSGVSKFKTRVLPLLLGWADKQGHLPERMTFSLASLLFYFKPVQKSDGSMLGLRHGEEYQIRDDEAVLDFFETMWNKYDGSAESVEELVAVILSEEMIWGQNLTEITGLHEQISAHLDNILTDGMKSALKLCVHKGGI